MQPRNLTVVHFDTDAGTDDAIALKLLASDPEYKIAAITVVGTGLAEGLKGANNMADLCNMLDMPDVPVAYGPDEPLDKNYAHPFPKLWRDLASTMFVGKNVLQHPKSNITDDPVELLRQTLLENEKVTIIATGALTNIARFFLQYKEDLNLISKIESIVIGGAVNIKGNMAMAFPDNTVGEWNIANDAKAAILH
jgi:inosine-uridine nucleoside N-ribohydrolase